MGFQGKEFTPEMIQLVMNLKRHFDAEKKSGSMVSPANPTGRTASGLGIGEATVKRIMARDKRDGESIDIHATPQGRPHVLSRNLQPVIREFIRSRNFRGQRVTVEGVRCFLTEDSHVEIPLATLWRSLKRWGFVYGVGRRRWALQEQAYVIHARRKYVRLIRANRNAEGTVKRPEIFLDETYINKNHSSPCTWYLDEDGPWVNKPSGVGPRLIRVHAISRDGWVDGAQLVFEAKKRTGDYHGQMNWQNFSTWFTTQLLPNIPANSIIVLENAKYHHVLAGESAPNSSSNKEALRLWLNHHDLPWRDDMLTSELLTLCKRFTPAPECKRDQIAKAHGHTVLRTPPYHPELQPIESCWAVVKNHMAEHCDFPMPNLRVQLPVACSKVTPKTCRGVIRKVIKEEDRYWYEDDRFDNLSILDDEYDPLPEHLFDATLPVEAR